jgi:hypothetical protein
VEVWLHSFLISSVDGGEIYAAAALSARRVPDTRVQRGLGGHQSWSERCSEERTVVHMSGIERWSPSTWVHDTRQAAGLHACVAEARSDDVTESSHIT